METGSGFGQPVIQGTVMGEMALKAGGAKTADVFSAMDVLKIGIDHGRHDMTIAAKFGSVGGMKHQLGPGPTQKGPYR